MHNKANMTGIALMVGGMFLFTVNDAIGKWLVADYAVGQLMAIRSFAALSILLVYLWHKGMLRDLLRIEKPVLQVFRVLLVIAEVAFFYLSVRELPLADVFLFYLASPIFVTVLSFIVLGEQVGWPRFFAVGIGFVGVILVFPPSDAALTLPALLALAGSLSLAVMMVLARYLRNTGGFHLITYQTTGVALAGALTLPLGWSTLPLGWSMPGSIDFILMCVLGVVATIAHFMLNHAMKVAPASVVAPFQYTSIIWAMILGYLVWSDVPSVSALCGAALIVVAGLIIFLRESREERLAEASEKAVTEV